MFPCVLLSASPALAQTALNLSVTGQAAAAPDEVTAALTAQGNSRNIASAQNAVNTAMAAALAQAKAVPGVTATTANYAVSQNQPDGGGPVTYQASQELDLAIAAPAGAPPPPFTALLARLQDRGFALQDFQGALSQPARRAAEQAAMADALRQIKAQAAFLAGQLGEKPARVESLTVSVEDGNPPPMPGPMLMARAFAPPQAAPPPVQVTATAAALVDLTPVR